MIRERYFPLMCAFSMLAGRFSPVFPICSSRLSVFNLPIFQPLKKTLSPFPILSSPPPQSTPPLPLSLFAPLLIVVCPSLPLRCDAASPLSLYIKKLSIEFLCLFYVMNQISFPPPFPSSSTPLSLSVSFLLLFICYHCVRYLYVIL